MIEVTAIITKSSKRIDITFGDEDGDTKQLTFKEAMQLRDELTELLDKLP